MTAKNRINISKLALILESNGVKMSPGKIFRLI
jgi:hypothetical protein